jgi:hypothetical protein
MPPFAICRIHFDYRLHPNEFNPNPDRIKMNMKVKHSDEKNNYHTLVDCQESSDGQQWLSCDGVLTVPEGRVFDDDLVHRIYFDANPGVNYDIDNISIESLGGPTDSIIVEDSVKDKWAVGAEVLITSHTNRWDDEQVRTITSIQDAEETGYVTLGLDSSIRNPITMKDSPIYAVEVAILSRNIRIQGANDDVNDPRHGGHLIIFHTPGGGQQIEGVEMRNMGQQGLLGRYVSC